MGRGAPLQDAFDGFASKSLAENDRFPAISRPKVCHPRMGTFTSCNIHVGVGVSAVHARRKYREIQMQKTRQVR